MQHGMSHCNLVFEAGTSRTAQHKEGEEAQHGHSSRTDVLVAICCPSFSSHLTAGADKARAWEKH